MSNENNTNKDVANSLSKYADYGNKGTNAILDSANQINKWYAEQLNKISEGEVPASRLETNIDDTSEELENVENEIVSKIETKVDDYNELQTNNKSNINIVKNTVRISTKASNLEVDSESDNNNELFENDAELEEIQEIPINKFSKLPKKISTVIKGVKLINNTTNKVIKTGKSINTGMNEGGFKSFENSSSKIMTKPIKKVINKATNKATNLVIKDTKKVVSNLRTKVVQKATNTNVREKVVQKTANTLVRITKLLAKLVTDALKLIISMLPEMAPVIIIIVIVAAFCSLFGVSTSEGTIGKYEEYMINTQNEYNKSTVEFYNQGKVVEGTIEGKGMINWRAPLSIIQMLNGNLTFDGAEKELLNSFKKAELFEKVTDVSYTYEKNVEITDINGNKTIQKQTVTETKKVVSNPSLDDFINWCNNNFSVINKYKNKKKLKYDSKQTKFTDNEIEQIKILYNSNSFFDLFSDNFKNNYAYSCVNIGDEQLQAIYNEFLKNAGRRYLMDHSNLKYDECMEYYDCSSWVIHCLAHCGIKTIPNTGAQGIYYNYCNPISVSDRKGGDLIFLKDTYDNGEPGSISHIGIYMGELTINGETTEWVIDTGGNPSGVRIRRYDNGWWNGSNFYGFARLK